MDFAYLLRSALGIPDYWHPYLEIQPDFLSGKIGRYPVTMDPKANYPGTLSDEGVPVTYFNGRRFVSPIEITLYGLGSHDAYIATGDQRYYRQMSCSLDWLEKHAVSLGDGIGWPYEFDHPVYYLKNPWFSSIVQACGLSLCIRGKHIQADHRWSDLAHRAWLGYHAGVEEGGFCRPIEGGVIYEEYPGPELDCVFNGMCVSLIGLWEAWQSGIAPQAEVDFRLGVNGLRSCLPRFSHGAWSLYSLNFCLGKPLLASPYYHRANGLLAQVIGLMAKDPEFYRYGTRWIETDTSIVRRIAMSFRIGLDRIVAKPAMLHSDKSKK